MIAADRVMVGDCPARVDQRLAGRVLDCPPLRRQIAMAAQGVEGEVGRRSVGVDMGEAARHLPPQPGGLPDRRFGRSLDGIVKGFEALPGNRGLECIGDNRPPH